jgi:acetyl-CoA acetyltransferase
MLGATVLGGVGRGVEVSVGVCVSGVGLSTVGRALFRHPTDLAVEACLAAIDDAGLTRDDIDGAAAFHVEGSAGVVDIMNTLALRVNWFADLQIGPSQISAIFEAIMAVETGRARHVVVCHSSCEGTVRQTLGRGGSIPGAASAVPERISGMQEWWLPFGAPSAGNHIAMYAQRHFHEYGTTREQMAQVALVERANAGKYEHGIYRDPLTMDDYLSARMITEPFCLFDCDIPIDFSAAVIISRADATSGLRKPPINVAATSTAMRSRMSWDQFDDLTTMVLRDVGADLWRHTELRPRDVDLVEIYDGFSFIAMAWLEALGFCGKGESGPFIEGGTRIALDGELPINTNGGQLSSGRMHGWGYLPEACRQLWGEGGTRQVPDDPEVAVVASGGGTFAGALLLTRS